MHRSHEVSGSPLTRRHFVKSVAAGCALLSTAPGLVAANESVLKRPYAGPNVIIVRFGGGVRRRETLDPQHTYSPYFLHELTKRGTLYKNMEIDMLSGVDTSHGQGTLYIATGHYDKFKDVTGKPLGQRFESKAPTVFEYLRKTYDVPEHEALIINGEDRTDEEFYSFSNHHLFGATFRSNVLSLYRFKTHLLRRQLSEGKWDGKELEKKKQELAKLESLDYRTSGKDQQGPAIAEFWDSWRAFYGETGLVNPRGDSLLTELALRSLKQLRPKLMMINYNDPDYVHWGYMSHYTRGIAVIDHGMKQLVDAVQLDPEYRDNTIFVIVPDCGRDSNPFAAVPCQHHFNSRSSHEIFALLFGPGVAKGQVIDKRVDQISVAGTIGRLMNFPTEHAEKAILEEAIA